MVAVFVFCFCFQVWYILELFYLLYNLIPADRIKCIFNVNEDDCFVVFGITHFLSLFVHPLVKPLSVIL